MSAKPRGVDLETKAKKQKQKTYRTNCARRSIAIDEVKNFEGSPGSEQQNTLQEDSERKPDGRQQQDK